MRNLVLEYVWLDGHSPANLRSKKKILFLDEIKDNENLYAYVCATSSRDRRSLPLDPSDVPKWSFDGSSTNQATTKNSDCELVPVRLFNSPGTNIVVLCEVYQDGKPAVSNYRDRLVKSAKYNKDNEMWFGIEQEYLIMDNNSSSHRRPAKWPKHGFPDPQGRYYCGVGGDVAIHREISNEHMYECLYSDIKIGGTNAEVMMSQWEYQIGPLDPIEMCDQLWFSRFLLERVAEQNDCSVSLAPKPVPGDWNGSGAHINFSTKALREAKSDEETEKEIERLKLGFLKDTSESFMFAYGPDNHLRMTGQHETSRLSELTFGYNDRSASIRIPPSKTYLEDRRPAANMDPYQAVFYLLETCCITAPPLKAFISVDGYPYE